MNPEEIPLNANIFSITDLTLPLTMLPARDRITGQIKRTALPRSASPCKRKEANRICGHGGIGRLGGFRFHCESVQVRVLLPAPYRVLITDLGYEHSILFCINVRAGVVFLIFSYLLS